MEILFEGRPEETGPMTAERLRDRGHDATCSSNGLPVAGTVETLEQQCMGMYICESQYMLLPAFYQPYDDETLARIYEYDSTVVWSCFEERGHPLERVPTWVEFRDSPPGRMGR